MRLRLSFALLLLGAAALQGCVQPIEAIEVSKDNLLIDRSTLPEAFEVWNANPDAPNLTIAVRPTENWIVTDVREVRSDSPVSASGPFDRQIVTVTINRQLLNVGTHEGFIELTAPNTVTREIRVRVRQDTPPVGGDLRITDVTAEYESPYLLNFNFGLRDANDVPIVAEPVQIAVSAREGTATVTSETGVHLRRAAARQIRAYLVLDYSASTQEIPGAIEAMEGAAINVFLAALNEDAQVGVYEFHVESAPPVEIAEFTVDRPFLINRIRGIDEGIGGFVGGSRMWDAMAAAAREFGSSDITEDRYIILFSDGNDTSSIETLTTVQTLATRRDIRIFTIGIGNDINVSALQNVATATGGRYFPGNEVGGLEQAFRRIVQELEGQYSLRWATLRRNAVAFLPSFTVTVNGLTRTYTAADPFVPVAHTGNELQGKLQIVPTNSLVQTTAFLRTDYVPRQIRRLRIFFQSSVGFDVALVDAADDGLLAGWTLTETPEAGGVWVDVQTTGAPIPFATIGPMLRFDFDAVIDPTALPFEEVLVDNSIYANGQSFIVEGFDD